MSRADLSLALATSLASAATYGLASALQHEQVGLVERRAALDPALVATLATRPVWLLGVLADVVAVGLQAVALHFGAVSLVQVVLVAGLPISVLIAAAMSRQRPGRRTIVGLLLCTVGLVLLVPAGSTVGLGRTPRPAATLAATAALVTASLLLLLVARRRPAWAGAATGVAAGIAVGAGSVLLASCAARTGDLPALLTSAPPYAALVVGLLGLMLTQAAFQTGAIGGPLAALSVTEPVIAVGLATLVLHEQLPGGAGLRAAGACGAVLAVMGVLALSLRPRSTVSA